MTARPTTGLTPLPQSQPQPMPEAPSFTPVEIGRIISVGSSKVIISINKRVISHKQLHLAQLGTILKISTPRSMVVAMVSSLDIGKADDEGMQDGCFAQMDIMGEITLNRISQKMEFYRGVRCFPVLTEPVYNMSPDELDIIFNRDQESDHIEVGRLHQDNSIIAKVRTDDLLAKHFAILGSTGSGKSCTVALVLQELLARNKNAHIVLLDPHDEYSRSFGRHAECIDRHELDLPLWLFNFEETSGLLTSKVPEHAYAEREILHEVIPKAKQIFQKGAVISDIASKSNLEEFDNDLLKTPQTSVDAPSPYRIRDLLKLIKHEMGRLDNASNIRPYKRLSRKIEALLADPRYQFIFRNQAAPASLQDIIGQIFRIPVNGRPICILDLSGVSVESLNIIVSVISRLAFDLAVWSQRRIPTLLVCEEAHRYVPADTSLGFNPTRKSISRIAKEGRKYGVSLGIISQRPSEIEPSILSQCSTVFSMRLSNAVDQDYVKAAVSDGAEDILSFLPSLGTAETMVFGESVNIPMRIRMNTVPAEFRPHSSSAQFSKAWADSDVGIGFLQQVVENWQLKTIKEGFSDMDIQTPPPRAPEPPSPPQPPKPAPKGFAGSVTNRTNLLSRPPQASGAPLTSNPQYHYHPHPSSSAQAQHPRDKNGRVVPPAHLQQVHSQHPKPEQTRPSNAQSLNDIRDRINGAFNRNL